MDERAGEGAGGVEMDCDLALISWSCRCVWALVQNPLEAILGQTL